MIINNNLLIQLDAELVKEAETILTELGMTMDGAVHALLTHVVAHKALPFAVQAPDAGGQEYPLHVHIEVLFEQIAVLNARLQRLAVAEADPARRDELVCAGHALLDMRFEFNPDSAAEVLAVTQRVNRFARTWTSSYP